MQFRKLDHLKQPSPTPEGEADTTAINTAISLRRELRLHRRDGKDHRSVLEDPRQRKFYRLGVAETCFVEAALRTNDMAKAYAECMKLPEEQRLSEHKATEFCKWLVSQKLAEFSAQQPGVSRQDSNPPLAEASSLLNRLAGMKSFGKAFFWKIPLLDPNRWLGGMANATPWLFGPTAMLVQLACFAVAIVFSIDHWTEIFSGYGNLFSSWRLDLVDCRLVRFETRPRDRSWSDMPTKWWRRSRSRIGDDSFNANRVCGCYVKLAFSIADATVASDLGRRYRRTVRVGGCFVVLGLVRFDDIETGRCRRCCVGNGEFVAV
ncbi:MAG: hypothetical protein R3C05_20565 [Pirellulaceae bacterium]